MTQKDEISRIMVAGNPVGVRGLKPVIVDMSAEYKERSDEEIAGELINRLSKINYIPESAKEKYGEAVLKVFYRYINNQFMEVIMEIKVLGPGCKKCESTRKIVEEAVAETGISAEIIKVTDTLEIAKHGVFGTPAVVVDGNVKSVGKIPKKEEIKEWIQQ